MWRTPLTPQIKNLNTDTLLLHSPDGQHFLTSLYEILRTTTMIKYLSIFMRDCPTPKEAIHHVYELPIIDPAIRCLHGAAGFPTKCTWLKDVQKGKYLSWTLVNVKTVNKLFLESKETQKGYM